MIVDENGFCEAAIQMDPSSSSNLKTISDNCNSIGKLLGCNFKNFRLETTKTSQGIKPLSNGSILYISTKNN